MHTMVSSNLEMLLINEIEKRQFKNRLMSNLEKQINTVLELRAKRRVPTRKSTVHTMASSKLEMLLINEIEKRELKNRLMSNLENRKKKHASDLK